MFRSFVSVFISATISHASAQSLTVNKIDDDAVSLALTPAYECRARERADGSWSPWSQWAACPSNMEFAGLTPGNRYRFAVRMRAVVSDVFTLDPVEPPPPPVMGFPNASNTGVPAGWTPTQTFNGLTVSQSGAVVENVRVNGNLTITGQNVTIRNVEVLNGTVRANCTNALLEHVSIINPNDRFEAVGTGSYTARRVRIESSEGFRIGGRSSGCGPVVIEDSFAKITSPSPCGDWHGDGIQGYDGPALTVRNTTLHLNETGGCGGTAPFFYPHSQGNTSVDIDRMLVMGGGASFRLGMRGPVRGLKIVNNSWGYFPKDVKCSVVTVWDAQIVEINADYQVTSVVRSEPCDTESGG